MVERRWPRRLFTGFCAALAVTTALGWFGSSHAWFEMLTNIPVFMLTLALMGLVISAIARLPRHAAVLAIIAVWFVWLLAPYAFASPDERSPDATALTALQYNVYFGNDDYDAMTELIRSADADVVALHEVTTEQFDELTGRLDEFEHVIAEPWDGPEPQLGGGLALLSRTPLDRIEIDPEASPVGRPILAASTRIGDNEVVVLGLHPHASRFIGHKVELRERQFATIAELLNADPRPAIVLTDMNVAPTSSAYRDLLDDLGWRDPHRLTGWDASWPAGGGWLGLPIDHVLVSNQISVHSIDAVGTAGSDHRALLADLSIESDA